MAHCSLLVLSVALGLSSMGYAAPTTSVQIFDTVNQLRAGVGANNMNKLLPNETLNVQARQLATSCTMVPSVVVQDMIGSSTLLNGSLDVIAAQVAIASVFNSQKNTYDEGTGGCVATLNCLTFKFWAWFSYQYASVYINSCNGNTQTAIVIVFSSKPASYNGFAYTKGANCGCSSGYVCETSTNLCVAAGPTTTPTTTERTTRKNTGGALQSSLGVPAIGAALYFLLNSVRLFG